ncbi:LCP family protein [Saccharomonospora azurea]|uniref:LCP family protein n=1 Tax=Saccharomonospora azurea TaxID=40988 RepID=UPI003D8CEC14
MTDDRTESLIRDALAHEANRAVDPNVVRNQLARSARAPRRRGPALIAATVAGVAGVAIAVTAIVVPGTGQEPDHSMPAAEQSVSEPTLVIAGMDANGQSDTVLLSRVRSDGVAVVSLPRDAWVEVPGHGQQRLSTAYQLGRQAALDAGQSEEDADRKGATTLVDTVATLTGESVDHYALVDTAAVGAVTTAIGGVEVCVHEAHHDPLSGVDLDAGRQTVSGDQALAFLRQRRELPEGDLDRMTRLQAFGESLFHSLADSEDAFTTVAGALDGHVRTDENLDVLGLAEKLASMSDPGLTTATIPIADPELTAPGGMAVIGVEEDEVREFVGAFLDGETPEGTTPQLRPTSEPRCVN